MISIFCLQVFASDRLMFWRESASGMSVVAHFLSRLCVNSLDILIQTSSFVAVYFVIRQPFVPFWVFFLPFLFTSFAASGWGYCISTVVPPKHGPFVVSLIIFILCGILGNPASLQEFLTGGPMEVVVSVLSITRWSIVMSFVESDGYLEPQPADLRETYMLQLNREVFYKRDLGLGVWWSSAVVL